MYFLFIKAQDTLENSRHFGKQHKMQSGKIEMIQIHVHSYNVILIKCNICERRTKTQTDTCKTLLQIFR